MASSAVLELAIIADDTITIAPLPARDTVTLGRDETCDIRIPNHSVSRRHAVLHLGSVLKIQDLGSANGTFVHDARSPTDMVTTCQLRKLSKEIAEIAIGERMTLGSIPIMVRRAAAVAVPNADPGKVVRAPAMQAIYGQVARVARSTISVLILGETGVGKEVLAHAVHDRSPRARGPFLELNCAALPPSLLESELFGYEKNAFTGASQARPGLLESADGGTIFLDEVGELPLSVQVKLLRVLEDRKVWRIGGRAPRALDVRFVAATNRDLEAEVIQGQFRQDLYFRLNGISLVIPPLRERVVEIASLAGQFLITAGQMLERTEPLRFSPEALAYLQRYAWPGNVRELRNVVERAAVLVAGDTILPADLPGYVTGVASNEGRHRMKGRATRAVGSETLMVEEDPERQTIVHALEQCAGNQTRAAKLLGISLRTLVHRLDKYNIARPRTRD